MGYGKSSDFEQKTLTELYACLCRHIAESPEWILDRISEEINEVLREIKTNNRIRFFCTFIFGTLLYFCYFRRYFVLFCEFLIIF